MLKLLPTPLNCDNVNSDKLADYSWPTHPTVIVTKRGNFWVRQVSDFKARFNNNFISILLKSPTLVYVGTYTRFGETDNGYRGHIVYDKGEIVYIQVCYQPYEIVTQQFFTHPSLIICHYFSHCRNCDLGTPPTHSLVQVHHFQIFKFSFLFVKYFFLEKSNW